MSKVTQLLADPKFKLRRLSKCCSVVSGLYNLGLFIQEFKSLPHARSRKFVILGISGSTMGYPLPKPIAKPLLVLLDLQQQ